MEDGERLEMLLSALWRHDSHVCVSVLQDAGIPVSYAARRMKLNPDSVLLNCGHSREAAELSETTALLFYLLHNDNENWDLIYRHVKGPLGGFIGVSGFVAETARRLHMAWREYIKPKYGVLSYVSFIVAGANAVKQYFLDIELEREPAIKHHHQSMQWMASLVTQVCNNFKPRIKEAD